MSIVLSRSIIVDSGLFCITPPIIIIDSKNAGFLISRKILSFQKAGSSIPIISITTPVFLTYAIDVNYRNTLNVSYGFMVVLPIPPAFLFYAFEITRRPIKRLKEEDTAQILIRGNVFYVNFLGIPTYGVRPLTVRFVNLSVSPVNEWLWDFGDGKFSTERQPIHIYKKAGIYTVKLTVGSAIYGYEILEKKGYIMVIEPKIGDIRLSFNSSKGFSDIAIINNDIDRDEGLETAVYISLFTDRRAENTDILLNNQTDRRGWWADNTKGSKLWLLEREHNLQELILKAKQYVFEALNWLIEEEIVENIMVDVVFQRKTSDLLLNIKIIQKNNKIYYYNYYYNWILQTVRSI